LLIERMGQNDAQPFDCQPDGTEVAVPDAVGAGAKDDVGAATGLVLKSRM
jgi:hypothetical protein